ncbi:MAG: TonB-dependent receptor [Chitinophagaceae bacterium]|nr:MAG: TonB-dependent receptor [Chitinophagaceae bacterium]
MRKMLLLLFASGSLLVASAQQKTIIGRVIDEEGRPVPYATVHVQGTQKTVTADADGAFSIAADGPVTLLVSSAGITPVQMQASPGRAITVTSKRSSAELQPVMVGSRRGGRVKTETAVPVDVISVASALPTGRPDLTANLNYLAPSLNYNKQTGSDGADHIELATLRGLGPDQTLVLVNGKRRHQTSFVSVFGTRGRGNSGTDLNAIPLSAIDRVEILRDGASAQYGSDAIAGVINLILKRSTKRLSGNVSVSGHNDPEFNTAYAKSLGQYEYGKKLDGRNITAGLNYGFPMGQSG